MFICMFVSWVMERGGCLQVSEVRPSGVFFLREIHGTLATEGQALLKCVIVEVTGGNNIQIYEGNRRG